MGQERTGEGVVQVSPDRRPGAPRPPRRGRQGVVLALTLLVGLALGLGAAYLLLGRGGPAAQPSVQSLDVPDGGADTAGGEGAGDLPPAPAAPEVGAAPPVSSATSAQAAVEGFLTAEALQDFEASYEYLAAVDHDTTYPTAAGWVAAHGQLQPIAGFEVEGVTDGEVTTITALDSRLDPVLGLVPGRARGVWTAVEEDEGWRVAYSSSLIEPLYPSDEGVAAAVSSWISSEDCGATAPAAGPLLGQRGLAEDMCAAPEEVTLGTPGVLSDGPETTALLDAYGPEVFTWARVVPVTGPVEARVVAAPVGDAWQVFAVLAPSVAGAGG